MSYTITIPLHVDVADEILIAKNPTRIEQLCACFYPFFHDEPTISRADMDEGVDTCFLTYAPGACTYVNLTFMEPRCNFLLIPLRDILPLYDRGDIAGLGLLLNKKTAQLISDR